MPNFDDRLADYVDVAERIAEFRDKYPDGSLQPWDKDKPYRLEVLDAGTFLVYTAAAYRDAHDRRPGVGSAWERVPGSTSFTKDSELQNAETSAWGRAIVAVLAADTKRGVASADEVRASQARQEDAETAESGEEVAARLGFGSHDDHKAKIEHVAELAREAKSYGLDDFLRGWRETYGTNPRALFALDANGLDVARDELQQRLKPDDGPGVRADTPEETEAAIRDLTGAGVQPDRTGDGKGFDGWTKEEVLDYVASQPNSPKVATKKDGIIWLRSHNVPETDEKPF